MKKITCKEYCKIMWSNMDDKITAREVLDIYNDRHTLNDNKIEDWYHTVKKDGSYLFKISDIEYINVEYIV
jgi:hypothetical protein